MRMALVHALKYTALGLVFALAGCHSTGNNFKSSGVDHLQPGISTMAEATEFLEADPVNRYYRPDGSYTARWAHVNSLVPDGIYLGRELWMEFDANHVLIRISKRQNVQSDPGPMPIVQP